MDNLKMSNTDKKSLEMFVAFLNSEYKEAMTPKHKDKTLYESPIGTRFRNIKGAEDLRVENAHWVKVGNETDIMTGRDTGNCICVLVIDGRFVIDDEILNGNTIPVPMR